MKTISILFLLILTMLLSACKADNPHGHALSNYVETYLVYSNDVPGWLVERLGVEVENEYDTDTRWAYNGDHTPWVIILIKNNPVPTAFELEADTGIYPRSEHSGWYAGCEWVRRPDGYDDYEKLQIIRFQLYNCTGTDTGYGLAEVASLPVYIDMKFCRWHPYGETLTCLVGNMSLSVSDAELSFTVYRPFTPQDRVVINELRDFFGGYPEIPEEVNVGENYVLEKE